MALGFDRRRISVKGGGTLKIRQIDPTPAATFDTLGFITDTTFADEHTLVESVDDAGRYIDAKSGAQKVTLTTTLMQTTKEEIDTMKTAEGKYFEVYYVVQLNNANYQELLFPVCRIEPGATLEYKSATQRTIAIKIHALAPATALTRTPTTWNSSQWQYYVLYENAAAANAPSDNGSVPQAAI